MAHFCVGDGRDQIFLMRVSMRGHRPAGAARRWVATRATPGVDALDRLDDEPRQAVLVQPIVRVPAEALAAPETRLG